VEASLTFDDGPEPRWTAEVLDALASAGARATFFVLAAKAVREPGLVERTLAEGHEVLLHGNRHLRHTEHDRATIEGDTDAALARLDLLGGTGSGPAPGAMAAPRRSRSPTSTSPAVRSSIRAGSRARGCAPP
jgi:peptidoglycan/xylan/chitin deacetylase (PgdA/CDA1 family)